MMEPSGLIDNYNYNKVCDISDEEVHFSRSDLSNNQQQQQQQQRSYSITIDQINPAIFLNGISNNANFTDINLTTKNFRNNSFDINNNDQDYYFVNEHNNDQERIKSNKILNCIGSKLRRGSNYLIAPKLVGQYLLGITIQSWTEFLNTSRMIKAPSNTQQLTRRLINNLNYFQGNYLCVSLILIIYCILTSPLLLLAIICYFLSLYFTTSRSAHGRPIRILNFKPNLQQQYSFITLISIPLLWVAGAPSAVFWVIGASFVVVGLHASMYNNDRIPLQNDGTVGGGNNSDTYDNNNNNQLSNGCSNNSIRQSTVQYYNHYPTTHQYLTIPSGVPNESKSNPTTTSNSYANVISQWMSFGATKNHHKLVNQSASGKNSLNNNSAGASSAAQQQRVPEVMIISQDYAGLGRVYEV